MTPSDPQRNLTREEEEILQRALFRSAKKIERAAQPDCRTCTKAMNLRSNSVFCANPLGVICTNGDKYQPAPRVVLWRTE